MVKGARFAQCEGPVVQGTGLHGKEEENFVERANLVVPPTADPHGGWCGGRELETHGYPIRALFVASRPMGASWVHLRCESLEALERTLHLSAQ